MPKNLKKYSWRHLNLKNETCKKPKILEKYLKKGT